MSLKNLIAPTKQAVVEYPGLKGFKVTFAAMSKQTTTKIHTEAKYSEYDKKTGDYVEKLDIDKFVPAFVEEAIKGWEGLTMDYLQSFILVDMDKVEDPAEILPFNKEDAIDLIKSSTIFEAWVNEVVFDLNYFRD